MTRRLLALIALLSGLAALHAPAHASRLDQLSYDVQALSEAGAAHSGASCLCVRPPKKPDRACLKQEKRAPRPVFPGVLPALMVIGVDRALE